jgi:hypothetical protein
MLNRWEHPMWVLLCPMFRVSGRVLQYAMKSRGDPGRPDDCAASKCKAGENLCQHLRFRYPSALHGRFSFTAQPLGLQRR